MFIRFHQQRTNVQLDRFCLTHIVAYNDVIQVKPHLEGGYCSSMIMASMILQSSTFIALQFVFLFFVR